MKIPSIVLTGFTRRLHSNQIVTFTRDATNKIRQLYKEQQTATRSSTLLKISVLNKGCSGNSYDFSWVSNKSSMDEVVRPEGEDDLQVVVDGKSIFKLIGSVVDWQEGEISSGFTFVNPNAAGACGCGASFEVKENV
jgi:iron-sulfur cluster assembly accessory protein